MITQLFDEGENYMEKTEMQILEEQKQFFVMQKELTTRQIADKRNELQELMNKQVAYDGAAQGVQSCIDRINKENEEGVSVAEDGK